MVGFLSSSCFRSGAGEAQITHPHLPSLQVQLAVASLPLALSSTASIAIWVGVGKSLCIWRQKHDLVSVVTTPKG